MSACNTMTAERVQLMRQLTWLSLALLVVAQLLESWLQQPPWLVWVMRVLPLLLFVPGMLRDKLRSYIWLCLVCLIYFLTLVLRLFADAANPVAWMAMFSLVGLFVTAMLYLRWRAQYMSRQ